MLALAISDSLSERIRGNHVQACVPAPPGHGDVALRVEEAEAASEAVEVAAVHAEVAGGGGPVALLAPDRLVDELALEVVHGIAQGNVALAFARRRGGERRLGVEVRAEVHGLDEHGVVRRDAVGGTQYGTRDDILQLAHVARPGVGPQPTRGAAVQAHGAKPQVSLRVVGEGAGEQLHVFDALAERRHAQRVDVQAVVEVGAEAPLLDFATQVVRVTVSAAASLILGE